MLAYFGPPHDSERSRGAPVGPFDAFSAAFRCATRSEREERDFA
jgi:hypothetical protein